MHSNSLSKHPFGLSLNLSRLINIRITTNILFNQVYRGLDESIKKFGLKKLSACFPGGYNYYYYFKWVDLFTKFAVRVQNSLSLFFSLFGNNFFGPGAKFSFYPTKGYTKLMIYQSRKTSHYFIIIFVNLIQSQVAC